MPWLAHNLFWLGGWGLDSFWRLRGFELCIRMLVNCWMDVFKGAISKCLPMQQPNGINSDKKWIVKCNSLAIMLITVKVILFKAASGSKNFNWWYRTLIIRIRAEINRDKKKLRSKKKSACRHHFSETDFGHEIDRVDKSAKFFLPPNFFFGGVWNRRKNGTFKNDFLSQSELI